MTNRWGNIGKSLQMVKKERIEDEMVGWYHQLNGREFEQTRGDGEGQGSLACFGPWDLNESDIT